MIIRTVTTGPGEWTSLRFDLSRGRCTFLGREADPGLLPAHRTIILLDPSLVSRRVVRLPFSERRKMREILPAELRSTLGRDPAELSFDLIPLAGGETLAMWVERSHLASILESLPAGVEATVATLPVTGWHMLIPERLREKTLLLSDGHSAAIYRGGSPLLHRPLAGALADELALTATTHHLAGNEPVEAILLFGGAAEIFQSDPTPFPPECTLLPVDELTSFCRFDDPADPLLYAGEASVVMSGDHPDDVNFLRGITSSRERERIRRLLVTAAILSLVLLIALFGRLELERRILAREIASLDRSIAAIYHEVFPKRSPVDPAAEIAAEIRRLSEQNSSPLILPTLRLLAEETKGGIRFTSVEIDGGTLTARGEAPSLPAAEELVKRLTGRLTEPSLAESSRRGDGTILFTLKGTVERGNR